MEYKVIEIYKDLPQTQCGQCNKPSCFAFAASVYMEGTALADCPDLSAKERRSMETKLCAQRNKEQGASMENNDRALDFLMSRIAKKDLQALSAQCGGQFVVGPPEGMQVSFLKHKYEIRGNDVVPVEGADPPTEWVKIFMLIYALQATGAPIAGNWISFWELPGGSGKNLEIEKAVASIARAFEGRKEDLSVACKLLGGLPKKEPGDLAFLFFPLPRVMMLFQFWDAGDGFSAKGSLLLDEAISKYLDLEAIVFMVEAFGKRLLGQGLEELIP